MLLHLAFVLLSAGVLLELAGVAFLGLDLLVGLCFASALVAGAVSAVSAWRARWGLFAAALATLALVFHVWLNVA